MKINEIISYLNANADWVDFNQTRDVVMFGDTNQLVNNVGVCWVATLPVIEQAIKSGVNFIISHENCFYEEGTKLPKELLESRQKKEKLLAKHNICVYRCHDVWDMIPGVGVADTWISIIGLPFVKRDIKSYNSFAYFESMTVEAIAKKIANALAPFGQQSVTVLGDLNQLVKSCGIGTGAATDVFALVRENMECVVLSDDGSNNWIAHQYCIDNGVPLILVHHSVSEIPGVIKIVDYLTMKFPNLSVEYLEEGYQYRIVSTD
ncbi:MAG: Nif3-like dinuclear metal center hexameric protein [Erysipelothrix sp.]|nr:Nif3-like dinuclear metal center hexameric protein [Erysipelothrix sp.]